MDILQLIKNGERITLDIPLYAATFTLPAGALALLIATPNVPAIIKQILAIPLLIANTLYPLIFTSHPILDLMGSPFTFTADLRFIELYFLGPILHQRPVYTSLYNLWVDFWSCLKKFPTPAKDNTKDLKKDEIKVYENDKKFYHILTNLLATVIMLDVTGAWVSTFTTSDIMTMEKERPISLFIYFLITGLFMTCGFNAVGYSFHFLHCIFIDGGSYSSKQWRRLMEDVILSSSIGEVWSSRWHQLFKSTWMPLPFRPIRDLTQRILIKSTKHYIIISLYMGTIAVFVISGLMHEYMILCNVGWPIFYKLFIGKQTIFFTLHGCGVVLEKMIKSLSQRYLPAKVYNSLPVRIIKHIWVLFFGIIFYTKFIEGFSYWGVLNHQPFQFSRPYIYDFVKSHPQLLSYFGSNI
ncbi:unnamed protein product [Cunninghamella blakesleeana]